ncbi:hypothetical protein JZ751_004590 [Albula glossodonta]|uniref:Transcription factor TFIIIC triple barrel domain-containing protein n=1 Tax=Albula glossodonta TaxID=121402 RepID=A0A8T2N9S7_9TELE|nr:hypothetical protein JZ751_004590 [Albula glossodonta]
MEDEWEEEEQLVVVELSGMINSDFLTKCQGKMKIVGIDTEQPMMQVGTYVFAGEYEDVLGTCVMFEETPGCGECSRPVTLKAAGATPTLLSGGAESSPQLRYKCHTGKKLRMQRTFLTEKKEGESSSEGIELLQLNDGDFPHRMICGFIQDPSVEAASGDLTNRGDSEAEASDSEHVEHDQDNVDMGFDPGSSV